MISGLLCGMWVVVRNVISLIACGLLYDIRHFLWYVGICIICGLLYCLRAVLCNVRCRKICGML